MLNRQQAPVFATIDTLNITQAEHGILDNRVPLYTINAGTESVIKLDFMFGGGTWAQPAPLVALFTNDLLNEGTHTQTAAQIAEKLDFYGAYLSQETGHHNSSFTVYCLNKHLPKVLEIVEDMIKNATYPESEFLTYRNKKKQRHIVESSKVANMARRAFMARLYGKDHPYGRAANAANFDSLQIDHIRGFYNSRYNSANCTIIASGKLPQNLHQDLNRHFGQGQWGGSEMQVALTPQLEPADPATQVITKEGAVQSAIRIGRSLFTRKHPDYFAMQVLNTVLGGYFSSRLMANIREDKGYTYGISSHILTMAESGYFSISSEVGAHVRKNAVSEIFGELKRLREEPIPENELSLVKNYLLADILRTFDGPFSLAGAFKGLLDNGLDYSFYHNYFDVVRNVGAEQLQELANQYLQDKDMHVCIAGV